MMIRTSTKMGAALGLLAAGMLPGASLAQDEADNMQVVEHKVEDERTDEAADAQARRAPTDYVYITEEGDELLDDAGVGPQYSDSDLAVVDRETYEPTRIEAPEVYDPGFEGEAEKYAIVDEYDAPDDADIDITVEGRPVHTERLTSDPDQRLAPEREYYSTYRTPKGDEYNYEYFTDDWSRRMESAFDGWYYR